MPEEVSAELLHAPTDIRFQLSRVETGSFGSDAGLLAREIVGAASGIVEKINAAGKAGQTIVRERATDGDEHVYTVESERFAAVVRADTHNTLTRLALRLPPDSRRPLTYLEFDFRGHPKLALGKKENDGSVVLEEYGLSTLDSDVLAKITVRRPLAKGAPHTFMQAVQTFRGVVGDNSSVHTQNYLDGDAIVLSVGDRLVPVEQFGDLGRVPVGKAIRAATHGETPPSPVQQDIRILPKEATNLRYGVDSQANVFRLAGDRPKSGYVTFADMWVPWEFHTEDYSGVVPNHQKLALRKIAHPEEALGQIRMATHRIGLERLGIRDHLQQLAHSLF